MPKIQFDLGESSLVKAAEFDGQEMPIDDLLTWCTKNDCSDLMIKIGERPCINRFGKMIYLNLAPTDIYTWNHWANNGAITSVANTEYVRERMHDFAYECSGYRYRVNVSFSCGNHIMTARMINPVPPAFVECGGKVIYPEGAKTALREALSNGKGGMVIFSAPTGNGKTTTLGSCINSWEGYGNALSDTNIITLEDPIEYIYNSKESTRIVQKELGQDFLSFANGIKCAMREHPTHILIGELRDKETIRAAIEAGRSGHTLMSTFHCRDIASTISRLLDNFSNSLAEGADLVSNLSLIICQRLLTRPDENGYYLECEYATFNNTIKRNIMDALRTGNNIEDIINEYIESNSGDLCGKESTLDET